MAEYYSYFKEQEESKGNVFPTYELTNGDIDSLFPILMQHCHVYELKEKKKLYRMEKETSPQVSDDEENTKDLLSHLAKRYEKPLRLTNSDRELPMTIILNTGNYKLPSGFSCALNVNFTSRSPTGFPDVVLRGSGNAAGPRSWSGVIFEGVNYSSSEGAQKFYNCTFKNNSFLKLSSYGEFVNCTFLCEGSQNTPLQVGKNVLIQDCKFIGLGDNLLSYINFKTNCGESSILRNVTFTYEIDSQSVSARRRFSPIIISGSNPVIVDSLSFDFSSDNAEVILFSSCANTSPVSLTATNVRAVNRLNNALYCAVLSNLWSNGASISFSNCTFEGMRMVLYGALRCSHLSRCGSSDACIHLRKVDSDWRQSLVISNTIIRTETQSDILAAAFDLADLGQTIWSLSFINSFLFVNRKNIPFNITNAREVSLNILGSSFLGTNSDPSDQQPWLNLENVTTMNIITSPSTTFVNLAPAARSGSTGTVTVINGGGIPLNQTN